MIYPKKLEKGSVVGLAATSSPITQARKEECIEAIKRMGYLPKAADNITKKYGGYMAGCGEERGRSLTEMFEDEEIAAIFCVRGGSGGSRALGHADTEIIKKNPKIFVGFSDVTCFHLMLNQQCELITFYGPMVSPNMAERFDEETERAFNEAINSDEEYSFKNPRGMPVGILKEGEAKGRITGGNLALLSASMGTPYEMDSKDKIIFVEEVNEGVSRIERLAYHLKLCGKFSDCTGVILGQFAGCMNEDDGEYDVLKLFADVLAEYDIPVMFGIQTGHAKAMMTIPLGAVCTMNTETKMINFAIER